MSSVTHSWTSLPPTTRNLSAGQKGTQSERTKVGKQRAADTFGSAALGFVAKQLTVLYLLVKRQPAVSLWKIGGSHWASGLVGFMAEPPGEWGELSLIEEKSVPGMQNKHCKIYWKIWQNSQRRIQMMKSALMCYQVRGYLELNPCHAAAETSWLIEKGSQLSGSARFPLPESRGRTAAVVPNYETRGSIHVSTPCCASECAHDSLLHTWRQSPQESKEIHTFQ